MDAKKDLARFIEEFVQADTPQKKEEHRKHFTAFLKTLSPDENKEFAKAFMDGLKETRDEIKEIRQEYELKKEIKKIQDVVSLSYIAKNYFGKTRHWLYHRMNGVLINGKPAKFTEQEIEILKDALVDISNKIKNVSQAIA